VLLLVKFRIWLKGEKGLAKPFCVFIAFFNPCLLSPIRLDHPFQSFHVPNYCIFFVDEPRLYCLRLRSKQQQKNLLIMPPIRPVLGFSGSVSSSLLLPSSSISQTSQHVF
jgi:hypothetical protein